MKLDAWMIKMNIFIWVMFVSVMKMDVWEMKICFCSSDVDEDEK